MFGERGWTWLRKNPEASGFWLLALLHLVPVWWYPYLPTQDGPAHLANAQLLLDYGTSAAGAAPGGATEKDFRILSRRCKTISHSPVEELAPPRRTRGT